MLQYNKSPNDLFFIWYSVHLCHSGYSQKKVPKTLHFPQTPGML